MCANDLEGIVAKRLANRYDTRVRWLKIKNPIIHRRRAGVICSTGHGRAQRGHRAGRSRHGLIKELVRRGSPSAIYPRASVVFSLLVIVEPTTVIDPK